MTCCKTTDVMNVRRSTTEAICLSKRSFSDDVIKIEFSGPDSSFFSILDIPGVFQSVTGDMTVIEKDGVRMMVEGYIQSKQSIIM